MDNDLVYLVQTDTTAGFLSNNDKKLCTIKQRSYDQKILQTVDSFKTLKESTRVPNVFKNKIRRSKHTTFIYPNSEAYRVVNRNSKHHNFIKKFKKLYSTSANLTGKNFDLEFACDMADVVVENSDGFIQNISSTIIKLNSKKYSYIR